MLLARRLYDPRAALYSGAVLATSFGYVFYARRATADLETTVGVLVAVWMFARHDGRPTGQWVVGLWLWMGAVSLTKGLLGFALPVAVFAAHGLWSAIADASAPNRLRATLSAIVANNRWFFNRWTVLAMPLGMLVFLTPYALAGLRTGDGIGLAMVWRENVQRFFSPHNHAGPPYLYLGVVFVLAAPWSAFLPAALLPPNRPSTSAGDRLAPSYFWAVFVFFTASASRRSYYLLPIVPAASLLIGRLLAASPGDLRQWTIRLRSAGWAILGLGTAVAGILLLLPSSMWPIPFDELTARGWIVAASLAALATLTIALCRPRPYRFGVTMVGALAVFGIGFGAVYPAAESLRTRRDFVAAIKDQIATDRDSLGLFDAEDIVFDLGVLAPNYQSASELETAVRSGQIRWIVTPSRRLASLPFRTESILREPTQPWESPERAGNKLVLLSAAAWQR
jgi:4-amino-4-deoxy-L-arabinose transferase-like glycosyltransferase